MRKDETMKDINAIHTFEVPLYRVPKQDFRETMKLLSHPQAVPMATVKYWREELTFTFIADNGKEISCSVNPIPDGCSKTRTSKLRKQISNFASKFNCSMSLLGKDKDFQCSVDVVEPSDESKALYGRTVCFVIKVTLIVTSLPVEMALDSFFTVIDMSPQNVTKK